MDDFKLLQGFGQLCIDKSIKNGVNQDFLIREIIESAHFREYPPAPSFQKSFWKWIIDSIEESNEEVDEQIYQRYMSLLPTAKDPNVHFDVASAPSSLSYTTYFIRAPKESQELLRERHFISHEDPPTLKFTLKESRMTIEQGTTGYRTWKPSLYLADWVLRHPKLCFGRVLELGCGVGLLGIVIASLQSGCNTGEEDQCALHLTDIDDGVVKTCHFNMTLPPNHLRSDQTLTWELLDWCDALPSSERREILQQRLQEIDPDVVFGADLVYDLSIVPALVHLLALLMSCVSSRPRILLTITVRRQETMDTFMSALGELNLRADIIELPPFHETVFAHQVDAVDKDVTIKLIEVLKQ
ncbi:hypothetical protein FRC18_010847 [Serendipita sp. 400]|nr:hypothetical protein FRC18_010847 [Serendipita sp. 400]